jgi:hypothetical protein
MLLPGVCTHPACGCGGYVGPPGGICHCAHGVEDHPGATTATGVPVPGAGGAR